jgi:hypothetical protein
VSLIWVFPQAYLQVFLVTDSSIAENFEMVAKDSGKWKIAVSQWEESQINTSTLMVF